MLGIRSCRCLVVLRSTRRAGCWSVRWKRLKHCGLEHRRLEEQVLPANTDVVLDGIAGRAMELMIRIDPQDAREVCVEVCRSPKAEETTSIKFLQDGYLEQRHLGKRHCEHALVLDSTRSSLLPDVLARPPEIAPSLWQRVKRWSFAFSSTGVLSQSSRTGHTTSPSVCIRNGRTASVFRCAHRDKTLC